MKAVVCAGVFFLLVSVLAIGNVWGAVSSGTEVVLALGDDGFDFSTGAKAAWGAGADIRYQDLYSNGTPFEIVADSGNGAAIKLLGGAASIEDFPTIDMTGAGGFIGNIPANNMIGIKEQGGTNLAKIFLIEVNDTNIRFDWKYQNDGSNNFEDTGGGFTLVETWNRTYWGGISSDVARDVAVKGLDNLYVAGEVWGGSDYDYKLIKYDQKGNQMWTKSYDGGENDSASGVDLDTTFNPCVTGYTTHTDKDYYTICYDQTGTERWSRTHNLADADDEAKAIAIDNTGNVYVTGYSTLGGIKNYFTIKYDLDGNNEWNRTHDSGIDDEARDIAVDGSGNVYVTGTNGTDMFTIKYDTNGNNIWNATFNSGGDDEADAIAVNSTGNAIVAGSVDNTSHVYWKILVYHVDGTTILWNRSYVKGTDAAPHGVAVDDHGGIYVTGSHNAGTGGVNKYDIFTITYGPTGDALWNATWDGGYDDEPNGIAIDDYEQIFLAGYNTSSGGVTGFLTIKYGKNFSMGGFGCDATNQTGCDTIQNCTWDWAAPDGGACIVNCWQYDWTNQSTCEGSFGGGACKWDTNGQLCDPFFFDKNFAGGSFCFDYDGNKTGCDGFPNDCVWFSEPNCPAGDYCTDKSGGTTHGFCDPKGGFDFDQNAQCWNYDGNKTGCSDAKFNWAWPCEWSPDPWGPKVAGATESGWCNLFFGGGGVGGGGGGCWDYSDQTSCDAALGRGEPCNWTEETAGSGWCEMKGCWDYFNQTACDSAEDTLDCLWKSDTFGGGWCEERGCWNHENQTACTSTTDNLDCTWNSNTFGGGWCEENGCWKRDWTNATWCEAKTGCTYSNGICDKKGCWQFDSQGVDNCSNKSLTGMSCQWKTGGWGYCEQIDCWNYDGSYDGCMRNTSGLSCAYDNSSDSCYKDINGCPDYNREFDCFQTGYCMWNGTGCEDPGFAMNFQNPGCWMFTKIGAGVCNSNVTACNWTTDQCVDNSTEIPGQGGIQCSDINSSQMCNKIPALSTCCQWNGTTCNDAPFSTSCWDSIKAPPEGASFCDDYNAKTSKSLCDQIAGDPWYMPCNWDNATKSCKFAFDNLFGGGGVGFDFKDIGSKANCEVAGGVWKSEKYTDNGKTYTDEWCEMSFGFGKETCDTSCWACEFQKNGSAWSTTAKAKSACVNSTAGCNFFEDQHAFNGYGWCDQDWGKAGNCDQNCWDCWDSTKCSNSQAACKWFTQTDPWNNTFAWCDSKNIKTCDTDCYSCWDPNTCGGSSTNCTWDNEGWFCKPSGSGVGGSNSEICFDGQDNDADTFIDCADPGCMFDAFCGGSALFGSNCLSIPTNETCASEGCVWITDPWNNSWCDMPGAQCWIYDDDEAACDDAEGCNYTTMSDKGIAGDFCDVNKTSAEDSLCWGEYDSTACNLKTNCTWVEDKWCKDHPTDPWCVTSPGWCDFKPFSCFGKNQSSCTDAGYCDWTTDEFNPGNGWCDPVCFTRDAGTCAGPVQYNDTYTTGGICALYDVNSMGWCEPNGTKFITFKGCWDMDNNKEECDKKNQTCVWQDDIFNNTDPAKGFCQDKLMFNMIGNMDKSPPVDLGTDPEELSGAGNWTYDIISLGIKDDPDTLAVGTGVVSMNESAVCYKFYPGTENRTAKFYWYFDTDGDHSNSCSPDDNSSLTGFEFKFKYTSNMKDGSLVETKVAYKCTNGSWSPSQIKLSIMPDRMCTQEMLNGGMVAISKEDLKKLKILGLIDDTADMRIYATTANNTNSSSPIDTIGPIWYTPGSADFKFENCQGFTDTDGDGLLPENDPDCTGFLRFGYINVEHGMDCKDNIDNDGNNQTDCNDPGCMYDTAYCTPPSSQDTSYPKITWKSVKSFTDGAFIDVNTNEPTNATVILYWNDTYCLNRTNATVVYDPKLNNSIKNFTLDDYDFWHGIPVDNVYFTQNNLIDHTHHPTVKFEKSTSYFYKIQVCDKAALCSLSACLNFTTGSTEANFTVGFSLPPAKSNVSEPMGKLNVQFDWDGDGNYDSNQTEDKSQKINESKGKKVNMKFYNPNASKEWCVEFHGANFKTAQSLNITDAFIANETANNKSLVGMKKDKWQEMAQKLGVNFITICLPLNISAIEDGSLIHCPDNVTAVSYDQGCRNINASLVNCTVTPSNVTKCEIPTTIGFSVFAGDASVIASSTSTTTTGGGGGGGGGSAKGQEIKKIEAGGTGAVEFNLAETLYISQIELTSTDAVYNVKVVAEAIEKKPYATMPDPPGAIVSYLKLTTAGITNTQLKEAIIKFVVPVSWLKDKDVALDSVMLRRDATTKWDDLPTTFLTQDADYAYFSAVTPGFSYFVITGDEGSGYKEPEVPATIAPPETTKPVETEAPVKTQAPLVEKVVDEIPTVEVPEEEGGSSAMIIVGVMAVLAAAIVLVLKKRGNGGGEA